MSVLPAVTVETVAVAPDEAPVIVSEVVKSVKPRKVYDIGVDASIVLPTAPLEEPVIFSPFKKVPDTDVSVNSGAVASVEVSLESKTAWSLKASALPNEISLSVALTPYEPSASAARTFNCLESTVVLVFIWTLVLVIVPMNLTLAPFPKSVLSVTVIAPVPSPDILSSVSNIISPWPAVPLPAVITDIR